jgi:multidrug resistance efflux pump
MATKNLTSEEAETAAAEQWLADLDPDDPSVRVRDARYLRHIREAADALENADARLRQAVAEARANGDSWGAIGMVLGTSRQAAQQRFKNVGA